MTPTEVDITEPDRPKMVVRPDCFLSCGRTAMFKVQSESEFGLALYSCMTDSGTLLARLTTSNPNVGIVIRRLK